MYETFYGLKEKPFSMIPDPEYLFLSAKHQRALTLLEYGMMNHASFSVICGDTGAGKTTLIRRLLSELGSDATVGLITNTHQSFGELLNWVLMAFGIDPENKSKAQMHQMFISFLIEQYAQNKRTILIVDEAQNMNADTLEELRMLSNINADKDQVIQVVLAGQPGLRETLRKPELMQFAQRISVDYYLEALNKEETATYIHHRLKIAGAEYEIFTERACSEIYKFSGGTPD
ncbi:MAG: AAA family ATPase [Gammaproteobacteria bacterium]|nr:AAA family ATPase [Gammaproteobacteria bacterium]